MKTILRVCMGSACHVKGAPEVARALALALEEAGLDNKIELMGRFCKDECQKGVVVEGPYQSWYEVSIDDVPAILSAIQKEV